MIMSIQYLNLVPIYFFFQTHHRPCHHFSSFWNELLSAQQHRHRVYLNMRSSAPFPLHVCAPFHSLLASAHLLFPCVLVSGASASLHSSGSHASPSDEGEVCPGGCGSDSFNVTRVSLPGRWAGLGPVPSRVQGQAAPEGSLPGEGGCQPGVMDTPCRRRFTLIPVGTSCVQGAGAELCSLNSPDRPGAMASWPVLDIEWPAGLGK